MPDNPLSQLHRFIVEHYNLEELRTLCFNLSVKYDSLGGEGLNAKARELLLHLGRQRRFDALLDKLREDRPVAFARIEHGAEPAALYDALQAFKEATQPTYQRIIQLAVSPLGLVALALGLIIMAAVFIYPQVNPPKATPTPTAFEPAIDESLIIVAQFDNRSEGEQPGIDPAQYIYEALEVRARADGLDVRIEKLPQVVDNHTARQVGETYSATLVLWGWYDRFTVTPRLERIRTQFEFQSTEEGQRMSLSDPKQVEFNVVTDLPSQASYLVLFTLGMEQYADEQFDTALDYLDSALRALPPDVKVSTNPAETHFYRGNIYYYRESHADAIDAYTRAIELVPDDAEAYNNRGITYNYMGEYEKVEADLTRAIELVPDDAEAYNNRGITYNDMGEYEKAEADYTRAIELVPDYAEAYNNRGLNYNDIGEYEKAEADYTRAIELDPDFAEAYNNRGINYRDMGEYEKAEADFTRAIELVPDDAEAYNNRGGIYNAMGKYEQAEADLTRAIELVPDLAEAYYNRGNNYRDMDEYEKAKADFTRAIELVPDDAEAYNNRGGIYNAMGEYEKAEADLTRAIELVPDLAEAYWNRGIVYNHIGEYEAALIDFERAADLMTHPGIYYNGARAHAQLRHIEDACAWLKEAIALAGQLRDYACTDPNLAPIRDASCFQALMEGE